MPTKPNEELEQLKELLAEAEDLCLQLAMEKYLEAQRVELEIERLAKELGLGRGRSPG